MKASFKLALISAAVALGGVSLAAASASALPMNGLDPALATPVASNDGVQDVRWICGPYGGCRLVPGWRTWGPRPYWRYGFYHPWRPWRPWGPYRPWRPFAWGYRPFPLFYY